MKELLWKADLGNGTFRNPVLFADYSDPDVIRVGDTFYMTASSFNYIPGLPILISSDLINWKLVNYALDEIPYPDYAKPAHARGVWAPSIRYHNGKFMIYYGMPDEGIFMVQAEDPLGKWEKPVLVKEGKGLIDSCPFWDEDGKAYLVHGYAKSRIGFNSVLGMFPMNPEGTEAAGEDRFIFNGVKTQPTIEGPKVYKRDGWYYIFAPAGGVETGWQTVLRSRHIEGPYEEKIVMRQGASDVNGPHQGGLVDTPSGQEWFLHFQDKGMYGRITHLQPVTWKDGWPIIGVNPDENGCGEPCSVCKKPEGTRQTEAEYLQASDDFSGERPGLQWQWLGNCREDFYRMEKGGLRLNCLNLLKEKEPVLWHCSQVLTQKLVCPYYCAQTCLDYSGLKEGDQAGMVMIGGQYAYLAVRIMKGRPVLVSAVSEGEGWDKKEKVSILAELENERAGETASPKKLLLRQKLIRQESGPAFTWEYSVDGAVWIQPETSFAPSDDTWVGAKMGLFAVSGQEREKGGYGLFEYMKVTAL